jgi:hypothetical protein
MSIRRRSHFKLLSLLLIGLLAAVTAAQAAVDDWRVVVRVKGDVDSKEYGQTEWQPIFRSRRLQENAEARTGPTGVANINLKDQSSFRLAPSSEVAMTRFELTPEGRTVVFTLKVGRVQANVAKFFGKQSRFEVRTPNGVLAARGTEFSVTVMKQSELLRLQGQPSKPQASAANVDGLDMLAASDPEVTLVSVSEGTVVGTMTEGKKKFLFHPGDNGIFAFGTVMVNPPNFPKGVMIPPSHPAPDPTTHAAIAQASNFQDPAHQVSVEQQFNRELGQYPEFAPYTASTSVFTSPFSSIGGGSTVVTPPLFNPSNIQEPLSNTTFPPVSPSSQPPPSPQVPTGRLIIIIR